MNGIVDPQVEGYLETLARTQHDDPVLTEMEKRADELEFPIVGRTVGRFLEQQARAVGARHAVELGSGFGYSAYWLARAVGADGRVTCSDRDEDNAEAARSLLGRAGLWDRIDFRVGEAMEVLAAIPGPVDVVFCDADKERYPDYWQAAADRIRVGGLYLCDNALWYGRAATREPTPGAPGATEGVVEHNRLVVADDRYVSSLVPLRDGVLVALRIS